MLGNWHWSCKESPCVQEENIDNRKNKNGWFVISMAILKLKQNTVEEIFNFHMFLHVSRKKPNIDNSEEKKMVCISMAILKQDMVEEF